MVPFAANLMASTPRVSSRVAGTFAAGQVIVVASVPNRGPLNPSEGNFAVAAPAGQRPRAVRVVGVDDVPYGLPGGLGGAHVSRVCGT
jgi:hypothetical protein